MNEYKIRWKNALFFRVIITFVLIITPLYFLFVGIYNGSVGAIKEQLTDSINSQVAFYMNNFDRDIRRIRSLQYDLTTDNYLNRLATISESMDDADKTQTILNLQQRLISIKNSSRYIKNVSVTIPGMGRIIYAQGSISEEQVTDDKNAYKPFQTYPPIMYENKDIYMRVSYPVRYESDEMRPLFSIDIDLNEKELESELGQFNGDKEGGALLLTKEYKTIVASGVGQNGEEFQKVLEQRMKYNDSRLLSLPINGTKYFAVYTKSDYLGMILIKYIPQSEVFNQLKKYKIYLWMLSLATILVVYLFSLSIFKLIHTPLLKLVNAFHKVENGEFDFKIEHNYQDEFRYLYLRFNVMVDNVQALIEQGYKQEILKQQAELKQLQSQINPHFLYNTFFLLSSIAQDEGSPDMVSITRKLGIYFRFITRNSGEDVPLKEEVQHARIYTEIQEMRFLQRVNIYFEPVPKELEDIMVPRLILQPIIENVFEHALKNKVNQGILQISFFQHSDFMCIIIEDNGEELTSEGMGNLENSIKKCTQESQITGVLNIHRRLQLKFDNSSGIKLARSELGGLKVIITIGLKGVM